MGKLGKEKGLISYATLNDYNNNMAVAGLATSEEQKAKAPVAPVPVRTDGGSFVKGINKTNLKSFVRPRTLIYAGFWALIGVGLIVSLLMRDTLQVNVLHDRNPQSVLLTDGSVRNGYTLKVLNMKATPRQFEISLDGLVGGTMKMVGDDGEPSREISIEVKPDQLRSIKVFVTQEKSQLQRGGEPFTFDVVEIGGTDTASYAAKFEAPK